MDEVAHWSVEKRLERNGWLCSDSRVVPRSLLCTLWATRSGAITSQPSILSQVATVFLLVVTQLHTPHVTLVGPQKLAASLTLLDVRGYYQF